MARIVWVKTQDNGQEADFGLTSTQIYHESANGMRESIR